MSLTIARVKGVKIRIHFTFFIVFALITWTLSVHLFPMLLPGLNYGVHLFVAVITEANKMMTATTDRKSVV